MEKSTAQKLQMLRDSADNYEIDVQYLSPGTNDLRKKEFFFLRSLPGTITY